jgi:hypothetical protein
MMNSHTVKVASQPITAARMIAGFSAVIVRIHKCDKTVMATANRPKGVPQPTKASTIRFTWLGPPPMAKIARTHMRRHNVIHPTAVSINSPSVRASILESVPLAAEENLSVGMRTFLRYS